jgi:glucose dehydrogenase
LAIAGFAMSILWQSGLLAKHFAGLTIIVLTLLLLMLRWTRQQLSSQAALSLSMFLILPLCLAVMSPFTLPDQTTQVARAPAIGIKQKVCPGGWHEQTNQLASPLHAR